jgi:multidrug efflux pump subunit AcrB
VRGADTARIKIRRRYLARPSGLRSKIREIPRRLSPAARTGARAPRHRWRSVPGFALASAGLVVVIGQNFFPYVDAGQMRLHVRPPTGTRIEEAAAIFASIESEIRRVIPAQEVDSILDNIGLPNSGINLAFSDSITNGNGDGEILISLKEDHHPTLDYTRKLRNTLAAKFPAETFFFQAADITSEILNFGLPAPVDVQVIGNDLDQNAPKSPRNFRRKSPACPEPSTFLSGSAWITRPWM